MGRESGFVLLSVLFLVALIMLSLTLAAPRIADDIRRDRESELYHRGLQYRRAIRLYFLRFGRYPTSLDQLEKTNEIRFLRKRYKDPITGKDEWHIIHFGEAKLPPMGLFGQPLTLGVPAGALAGTAPNGANTNTGVIPIDPNNPGMTPPTGGGGTGLTAGGTNGTTGAGAGTGTGDQSATGPLTGGGGPIVGVSSTSTHDSIREYRKQKHYNEWEFVYDPSQDRGQIGGAGVGTGAGGSGGVPPTGQGGGNGPGPGGPGAGGQGGPPPGTGQNPPQ